MKVNTLGTVNVHRLIVPVIFGTDNVSDETLNLVKKDLRNLELLITEMLDQGVSPYAVEIDDLAEMTGISAKEFRKGLKRIMKVAHDKYDGTFDKPDANLEPEQLFYILAAYVLGDCGRVSDDPAEWTVRYGMSDYFEFGAIKGAKDMLCWAFLVEYFEDCLNRGRIPITNYIKQYGNLRASARRLMTFMKNNSWYGDANASSDLFMLCTETPSLSSILSATLEQFDATYRKKKEEKEWLEIDNKSKQSD
jgi:hypothetical protein